jgi:hypothetical protein
MSLRRMNSIRAISAGAWILISGMGCGAHIAVQQPARRSVKATLGNFLGMKLVLIPPSGLTRNRQDQYQAIPEVSSTVPSREGQTSWLVGSLDREDE